jgi:hypothetical protein
MNLVAAGGLFNTTTLQTLVFGEENDGRVHLAAAVTFRAARGWRYAQLDRWQPARGRVAGRMRWSSSAGCRRPRRPGQVSLVAGPWSAALLTASWRPHPRAADAASGYGFARAMCPTIGVCYLLAPAGRASSPPGEDMPFTTRRHGAGPHHQSGLSRQDARTSPGIGIRPRAVMGSLPTLPRLDGRGPSSRLECASRPGGRTLRAQGHAACIRRRRTTVAVFCALLPAPGIRWSRTRCGRHACGTPRASPIQPAPEDAMHR